MQPTCTAARFPATWEQLGSLVLKEVAEATPASSSRQTATEPTSKDKSDLDPVGQEFQAFESLIWLCLLQSKPPSFCGSEPQLKNCAPFRAGLDEKRDIGQLTFTMNRRMADRSPPRNIEECKDVVGRLSHEHARDNPQCNAALAPSLSLLQRPSAFLWPVDLPCL